ncbi:MAG: DUF2829 domain-containing protein [Pseudomonadota bacterium]
MTKTYYGTKQLLGRPMTRQQYLDYRGWQLPADEDPADEGYLVEYLDGGSANHPDHKGYISWSPRDVFEQSYQPVTAMNFGHAIAALKTGAKVARAGWNGKGMFIALTPGSSIPSSQARSGACAKRADEIGDPGATIDILPHIDMRAADGCIVVGWLASQTDMLADDWQIIA